MDLCMLKHPHNKKCKYPTKIIINSSHCETFLLLLLSHLLWLCLLPDTTPWIWWSPVHQRLRSLFTLHLVFLRALTMDPAWFPLSLKAANTPRKFLDPPKNSGNAGPCPVATGSFHFLSPRLDRSLRSPPTAEMHSRLSVSPGNLLAIHLHWGAF